MAESSLFPTETHLPGMDAALSALEAAGWVCVPRIPTEEMIDAGVDNNPTVFTKAEPGFARDVANDVYVAMVRTASNPKEKPMVSPQVEAEKGSDRD